MVGSEIDQMRVATSFLGVPTDSRDVYVAHNVIDASRPEPTTGIKWHSRRGVIADNILTAGLSRIAITTDSGDELTAVDEDLGIVLVERNLMRLSFGGAKPQNDAYADAGISFNTSHHVVLRHNLLCDIPRAFADSARGAEPPAQHVSIYNNSITKTKVAGLNGDEGDFLAVQSVPDDWHVFNNVVDVADGRSAMLVRIANHLSRSDLAGLSLDHNVYHRAQGSFLLGGSGDVPSSFSAWQAMGQDSGSAYASAHYVSVDPAHPQFLHLSADSVAIDAGRSISVAYDYAMNPRVMGSAVDVGAFERSP
jgi:hypothetical protein